MPTPELLEKVPGQQGLQEVIPVATPKLKKVTLKTTNNFIGCSGIVSQPG
jgi:hypothetical protein